MSQIETSIFLGMFVVIPLIMGIFFMKNEITKLRSKKAHEEETLRKRSNFWYSLPIIGDLFGGAIAYGLVIHDDPRKARFALLIGLGLSTFTLLGLVIAVIIDRISMLFLLLHDFFLILTF